MAILSANKLTIGYTKKAKIDVIQSELQLELRAGELVCLIGPNGSGKSTLLRTLAGLQKSLSGETLINNLNISKISLNEKARLIALVLTDKVEIENATVQDIVSFGRHPYSSWWGGSVEDDIFVREAIEMVHLEHKKDALLNELSDGERQRVMIAKALAQDTSIIMLDEPTAHLDLPNRVEIMLLLHRLAHKTGKAILLSTHELDLALQAADRIWLMNANKEGVESGVPEDLVLNGSFNRTFESKSYFFNAANGNFSMNYPLTKKVWVAGDKTRMYWTLRALARAGFMVVENASITIEVTENGWLIANDSFATIEQLLLKLESSFTN